MPNNASDFKNPVQEWIVELAKEVGIDISGFKHKVTQEFRNHTLSHHGNKKAEESRGQIAVTEKDLDCIDEILKNPTFAVADAVAANSTVHSAQTADGGSNLRPRSSID